MPKCINSEGRVKLHPGYYILKIISKNPDRYSGTIIFERDQVPSHTTKVPFEMAGLILVRLYSHTIIFLDSDRKPETEPPILKIIRLPNSLAACFKLLHRGRLRQRAPLIAGQGYVCILSGIQLNLSLFQENAVAQRELARLGLHDSAIPDRHLFDSPMKWLPSPNPVQHDVYALGKIGVFLHLFYTDLWSEFAAFLGQVRRPFDLWITHCGLEKNVKDQIFLRFPNANIIRVENRGRDILPFISFLNDGVLADYNYICKIHTKKSIHDDGSKERLLGSRWRRRALYDLLAVGQAEIIVDAFKKNPSIGIAGPTTLRIPNAACDAKMAWGSRRTRDMALQLMRKMGANPNAPSLDYFAGSMFWITPAALEPIRQLNLQHHNFPPEMGQVDGELQHAVERLFLLSAQQAKKTVLEIAPLQVTLPTSSTARSSPAALHNDQNAL